MLDQLSEPIGQHGPRHTELVDEVAITALATEDGAQDTQGPDVAQDGHGTLGCNDTRGALRARRRSCARRLMDGLRLTPIFWSVNNS
jgi:hypothetical protein